MLVAIAGGHELVVVEKLEDAASQAIIQYAHKR